MPRSTSPFVRVFLLVGCSVGVAGRVGAQDPGAQVLDVFTRRCAECHGSKAEPKKRAKSLKRLNTIDDLAKLRQNLAADGTAYKKKVVDVSNPKNSELLSHTVGSEADMPQDDAGEYVALPAEEQVIVQAWFEKGMPLVGEQPIGGEAKPSQPAAPRPAFVDEEVWIQTILADLKSLSAADQKQARYFTMGHLYNFGVGEAGLLMQRRGLTKLLNSLSWNPRLAELTLLGPGKAIARVSLRDLDWDDAKWERVLAVPNNYFVRQGLDEEKEIARLTGTRLAYVRSDWFVFQAAQPPLYHDLLAPRAAPQALETDLALEQYLGVDVAANIANFQVARAGFEGGQTPGGSGVSENNRMLERHAITKWDGAYWKSYDFGANADEKSIFERPFGPKTLPHWTEAIRQRSFVQDGGEIIWNLPNGMQGYLLVDAAGKRIDEGPQKIVRDRAESGGLGTAIVNGISCMACHAQGMKRQTDRVRARIEQLTPTTFTRGERQMAQKLFPEAAAWTALLDRDEARYADAAKRLGVYGLDAYQREPVLAVFQTFRNELLKFDEAAFELGMSPEQLTGQLGGDLAPLRVELEDKGVPRDRFLDKFRAIARALRIELLDDRKEPEDPTEGLKTGGLLLTGIGLTMIYVEPGEFAMGSPDTESGRDPGEARHTVKLTKGYWLGQTEVTQGQWKEVMKTEPWKGKVFVQEGDAVAASYISHEAAREFCRLLTEREAKAGRLPRGYRYVLPTEAEWERAARSGSDAAYSFGSDASQLGEFAVFAGRRDGQYAHRVRSRRANAWGFYDMHGNLWEWCADQCDYRSVVVGDAYDPNHPEDAVGRIGSRRVYRGGGWSNSVVYCRSAGRSGNVPGSRNATLGFRPALAARSDHERR